jgi:DNA invertase Pin-like site-specific DNA recombinase
MLMTTRQIRATQHPLTPCGDRKTAYFCANVIPLREQRFRERRQFAALSEDASRRKFDCVLFWALDRFSREGMVPTIHHLERLNSYGVTFHSYTEPHLCADNEMVRGILLAVLATMAKQEAKRLSERVIAGAQGRCQGHQERQSDGRPRVDAETERAIKQLPRGGTGINKTAATVGVGTATVQRIRAEGPFESEAAA